MFNSVAKRNVSYPWHPIASIGELAWCRITFWHIVISSDISDHYIMLVVVWQCHSTSQLNSSSVLIPNASRTLIIPVVSSIQWQRESIWERVLRSPYKLVGWLSPIVSLVFRPCLSSINHRRVLLVRVVTIHKFSPLYLSHKVNWFIAIRFRVDLDIRLR